MKRVSLALALCCSLFCSAASAKTFVAVLWPMFGPLPAIGLVELVAELKFMPDVEVRTYLHQEWPSLVEDIDRLAAMAEVDPSASGNPRAFDAAAAREVLRAALAG